MFEIMNLLILLFLIFADLFIFFLMNRFYDIHKKNKIKKYLLNCEELDKQVLKSIFNEHRYKEFLLTKNNSITNNIVNLNIATAKDSSTNRQLICVLNLEILDLIESDLELKKIYLEINN